MSFIVSTQNNGFDKWVDGFVGFLTRKFEAPARKDAESEILADAVKEWAQLYKECIEAQAAAEAARAAKDRTREMIEEIARHYSRRLERICKQDAKGSMAGGAREGAGWPVLLRTEVCEPLVVGLFFEEISERNAMPAGVQFCEMRCQVGGERPSEAESLPFMALETRPPYRADFAAGEAGQTAWLAFRWIKEEGAAGPWSAVYSVVVPG